MLADPTGQRQRNRGGARDDAAAVELADGDSSGETTATSVFPKVSRVD